MKILIGTPVPGNTCNIGYADTLFRLGRAFQQARPGVEFARPLFIGGAIVSSARNIFASLILQDDSFTHLLFIDSDMSFRPALVAKLLDCKHPFVGAVCPMKRRSPDGSQEFAAESELLPTVRGSLVQARIAGTGILLLHRSVFERMADRYPELVCVPRGPAYTGVGVRERLLQCFEPMQDEDGLFLSEDFSFSRRWVEGCGGEIWLVGDEMIGHSGHADHWGRYFDKLRSEQKPPLNVSVDPQDSARTRP